MVNRSVGVLRQETYFHRTRDGSGASVWKLRWMMTRFLLFQPDSRHYLLAPRLYTWATVLKDGAGLGRPTSGGASPCPAGDSRWPSRERQTAHRRCAGRSSGAGGRVRDGCVSRGGGTPEPLTTVDGAQNEFNHEWPEPGGEAVLFTIRRSPGEDADAAQIVVRHFGTGERRVLVSGGSYPTYVSTGAQSCCGRLDAAAGAAPSFLLPT